MNYHYIAYTLSLSYRKEESKATRNKVENYCCLTMVVRSLYKGMKMENFQRTPWMHRWSA